jgi:predicted AAA+ superfamily ATPase
MGIEIMFYRQMTEKLQQLSQSYPVVTITGPRQSGKTTLVRQQFPEHAYVNLENPEWQALAESDPKAIFTKYPDGIVFDEIQRVPQLLSYIQVLADEAQQAGQFILTGSHQLALQEAIAQSLAGRTAILQLLPLSLHELALAGIDQPVNKNLLKGGYPRIYQQGLNPIEAYQYYFQTYLERDLRLMINVKDLMIFQRFMQLCAARVGSVLNMHNLSNEVGVSHTTIKHWISILQASFLVVLLPPYFENFGKRVIKSPKLYFTDVGLVSYLLEIETVNQMDRDPLRGQLFENLVVIELMKTYLNQGRKPPLYYYRDSQQHEVDVLIKRGHELIPIEIKSAQTFTKDFTRNLQYFNKLANQRAAPGYVIYTGDEFELTHCQVKHYSKTADIVQLPQ